MNASIEHRRRRLDLLCYGRALRVGGVGMCGAYHTYRVRWTQRGYLKGAR